MAPEWIAGCGGRLRLDQQLRRRAPKPPAPKPARAPRTGEGGAQTPNKETTFVSLRQRLRASAWSWSTRRRHDAPGYEFEKRRQGNRRPPLRRIATKYCPRRYAFRLFQGRTAAEQRSRLPPSWEQTERKRTGPMQGVTYNEGRPAVFTCSSGKKPMGEAEREQLRGLRRRVVRAEQRPGEEPDTAAVAILAPPH